MTQHKQENPSVGIAYKIFYFLSIAAILFAWVYAFRSYFEHYDSLHPEITWAVPWLQSDIVESRGVFLWNETKIISPRAGTVKFPLGTGPVKVQKGVVVARVTAGGSADDIKAPDEGYFLAGLDGLEGNWRYASLWSEEMELPKAPDVKLIKDGESVQKGVGIGKIVQQPQDLRFIGYADLTGNLVEHLASYRVMVKMDALDTPSRAQVRVYEIIGHRAKIYLNMPWFPPDLILSRNYELIIGVGETSGVTIPESAVTIRDGRAGTFVLRGSVSHFSEVKGRTIDGGRFLVTDGLRLGDAVIVDASAAREGRVKLW
ncbi:MAG: efflux RND transporter periplasmic adaptor subunit [Synergistaceae bacterium]|nr:efflux RND transporter periplasmic adaptor subunit [Synergistaceae bacterium]